MLDIKWIREHQEQVQAAANGKGIQVSVAELLTLDNRRKLLLQEVEQLRQARNQCSQDVGALIHAGKSEQAEVAKQQVKEINGQLDRLEAPQREVEEQFQQLMLLVPNVVSPDTPRGRSDEDNVELERVGTVPDWRFELRDHMALGQLHSLIDVTRGVKTAGTRNYYLTGAGSRCTGQYSSLLWTCWSNGASSCWTFR